jgi:hypothetical protein
VARVARARAGLAKRRRTMQNWDTRAPLTPASILSLLDAGVPRPRIVRALRDACATASLSELGPWFTPAILQCIAAPTVASVYLDAWWDVIAQRDDDGAAERPWRRPQASCPHRRVR